MHDPTDPTDPTQPIPAPPHADKAHEVRQMLRRPDPGSRRAATITLLLLIPALVVVVALQQLSVAAGGAQLEETAKVEVVPPAAGDGFTLVSKMMVKFDALLTDLAQSGGQPQPQPRAVGGADFMNNVDTMAASPSEKLRAAIVAGQLVGTDDIGVRLDAAAEATFDATIGDFGLSAEASTMLLDDLQTLDQIYRGETITDDQGAALVERHGWFGELALAHGDDAALEPLVGGGGLLLTLLALAGGVMLLAFVGGFVVLILAIVYAATGKLKGRFVPPLPGGSVYLETFAVFVLGFMLLQAAGAGLSLVMTPESAAIATMGLQWLLLLTIAWPLVRGVPRTLWREQMGMVAPRGVFREIGAGVVGYMAGIPLYVGAAAASMLLLILREFIVGAVQQSQGGDPAPVVGPSGPVNPVFEMVSGQGALGLVVLASLVVLWAPIVEELVMRGALYRHLRGRLHWVVSALVSAMLFGVLHQYDVLMLLPVITLGLVFAGVREWRGSIIGCITGHMLHNATVFGLVVAMLIGLS
ncbi:MAG: type II CAAX endopeptidase family protein [Planctomycetota bacterium]